jgi:hypothetical protein
VIEDAGAPTVTIRVPPVAPLRFWVSWLGHLPVRPARLRPAIRHLDLLADRLHQTQADFVGERDESYYFRVRATDHGNDTGDWVEAGLVVVSAVTKYYLRANVISGIIAELFVNGGFRP